MKEKFYSIKGVSLLMLWAALFLSVNVAKSQNVSPQQPMGLGDLEEQLWQKGEAEWKNSMATSIGVDRTIIEQFLGFNQSAWYKDRGAFFSGMNDGTIGENNAGVFFDNLTTKYTGLWKLESGNNLSNSSVTNPPIAQGACNPSCYNINFNSNNLSGWNAYYAVDASTQAAFLLNSQTGGPCGAVTQSGGPDPNTGSDYQVTLMTTPGSDPVAGGLIPFTPPLGGLCARIGDGPINGSGVGILQQTYMIDASAPILTIQYAVVIEYPPTGHLGDLQPWFKIETLDQFGNPIPGCGQYFVIAATGLPGFKAFPSPINGDTAFARPWSTAFVPLYNHIGECVTVRFTASDCALGGHFGYAYVAATCSKLDLVSSSAVFCTGQQSATITGPPGAATYTWSTPNGCISGSNSQQVVKVTCGGTYSLITQSSAGAQCVDTFSIEIPNVAAGPPPVPCFTATRVCSGNPTQFDATCSTPATGNTYYWDFYNSGHIDDSTSGLKPTWIYTTGGYYTARLHIVTANGCGADTIITVAVDSSSSTTAPVPTVTNTNASSCSTCNGSISLSMSIGSVIDTIRTSFDNSKIIAGPGLSITSGSFCTSSIGNTISVKWCNLCPGVYYIYVIPKSASGSTVCNPNGFHGDTIQVIITGGNVYITANTTLSNASCGLSNGSASLTGIGGTSPYAFTWSGGLGTGASKTNMAPGTYTVTIKDAAGCIGVTKVVINNTPKINANAVPFDVSCFGANDGSVSITPTSGVAPYAYVWSPNVSTTTSATGLGPGTYTVALTDAGGCTGTVSAVVSSPTQVIASIVNCTCSVNCGQTGSSTAKAVGGYGPYTYKWSTGSIGASVTGLSGGPSTVVVTDAFGCKDSIQVNVTINGGPTVNTVKPPAICVGDTASLLANTATGITYIWSPAPVGGCASCLNTTTSPTSTTTYTLTVKDGTGCSASAVDTVTVNPLPVILISPADSICIGANATITAQGGFAYSWSNNQSAIGLDSIKVSPPVASLNYTYTVVAADLNGCISTKSTSVYVNPLPSVLISAPISICLGVSTTITATGGSGYSWSTGQTGIGLMDSITISAPPVGTSSYTVTVVDGNGCVNTDSTRVTVTKITLGISPDTSLCPGSSAQLTSSGGNLYAWTPPGSGLSCYNCFNPVATPPGTTTYTVNVTDVNGCKGDTSVMVTINPQLTVNTSPSQTICIGDSAQITVFPTGGTSYTYTWSPGITAGLNDSTIKSPMATPLGTTIYSVEVNDVNGCHGTSQDTVNVNQLPVVVANLNAPICFGISAQLTASGASFYKWSTGQSGIGLSNITITPQVGTYTFTVTGIDNNGCVNVATTSILVNPLPQILISPPDSICLGASRQLTASGGSNYVWSNGFTGALITVTPVLGPNNFSVSVTDTNGCFGTNSVTIFVDQPPTATASGMPICFGQTSQLTSSGGMHYTWTPALYLSDPYSASPTATPADTLTYTYTVEVTNGPLCPPAYANATVAVSPIPSVKASADTSIIAGTSAQLTSATNGLYYNWTPSLGLSCTTCSNPLASPMQSTMYIVTTSDQYGCVNADTVIIKVDDILTLYVPTAFSPYNSNSIFYAYGVGIWQFEFYIFDRWGTLIFQTTDPNVGWDGSYNGQVVQSDVYVWLARAVSITGKTISKTGPVTVVH